jgi:hypothetical protein
MKLVIRTVCFHFACIIIFTFLYYSFRDSYRADKKEDFKLLDYLLLSTTIQAGVGISDISPVNYYGKIILIFQQVIMIMSTVFTLYIFNL